MLFSYKALKDNKIVTGKIEANDQKEVIAYLRSGGHFPIEIKRVEFSTSTISNFFNRVSISDIAYMTRQLAIMLNAGLTLIDSLSIIKKQIVKPNFRAILDEIDKELREGKSFSESIKKYPNVFSTLYIALVKSGEASGKLHTILIRLADTLEKQKEFQSKVKNALIYPSVIFSAMFIMMFIMVTFVTPRMLDLYKDFNITLPLATQVLIVISSFSATFWPFIIGGIVLIIIGLKAAVKTPQGKLAFDSFMLKVPVIGKIMQISTLVEATRTLSILISSGVSILEGLEIVTEANQNQVYKKAFANINIQVEKGVPLGTAMQNENIFPPSLIQMTTVGEQTGHLDETLQKISQFYESESEIAIKSMITLIEPVILIFLGVGVGFLVMAVITPIYSLSNSLQ